MEQRNSLEWRQLGSGGLRVSALGLGCMSLSGVYGESKDEEAVALIRHALEQGVTLLDSADLAAVITSSGSTPSARRLSATTGVVLVLHSEMDRFDELLATGGPVKEHPSG